MKSTARKLSYLSLLSRYPVYSFLLLLDEYEKKEYYEECASIKEALDEYNKTVVNSLFQNTNFPTNLSDYESEEFQTVLNDNNAVVTEKYAKEKAALIKLKLPVNNGLSNYKK